MVKRTKKEKKLEQICIPKCCQQPRSRSPKPRTDFSFFLSPSSSSSSSCSSVDLLLRRLPGPMLELSTCKDGVSSITTSMDEGYDSPISRLEKKMLKISMVPCNRSLNEVHRELFSNSAIVLSAEDESVAQNVLFGTCNHGNTGRHKSDPAAELAFTPDKSTSRNIKSSDVWITPGRTVWAKTACGMWWPAEIMEKRSAPISVSNQVVDGLVLVKYYGNNECAWVDPTGDISRFEDCLEERSRNPMEAFQDALKQALYQKKYMNSGIKLNENPDGVIQHAQSSNKWNASSSSRTEDDYVETGRGKRKRKPKVHFDEVTFPTKSVKKLRRLRIMRLLGLTAPVGSPFSITSPVRRTT